MYLVLRFSEGSVAACSHHTISRRIYKVHYTHFIHHSLVILSTSKNNRILRNPPPLGLKLYPEEMYRYCIRCSDCVRAGRPRGRSSSLDWVKNFQFSKSSRPALGGQTNGYRWLCPLGIEVDCSPVNTAEIKKRRSIPPLSHMCS
jgi:hypothetical protein